MNVFDVIILGIVEGLTEFLPISSTGHLILVSKLLGLEQNDALKAFEISIQLGSILAVLFLFSQKLITNRSLWVKISIAFLPTAISGFLLYKHIKALFGANSVAIMLIVGGIIFLILEYFRRGIDDSKGKNIDDLSIKDSIIIGLFQTLAMIPGTSRSGSTIVGGLIVKLSRRGAAEFSFLLAIPTMFAATFYDLFKNRDTLVFDDIFLIAVGFVVAFLTSYFTLKAVINFLAKHTFVIFGIYRIIIGVVFLLFL